jgi:hypothetical protein
MGNQTTTREKDINTSVMNYLLTIIHVPSPENELQKEVFEYLSHGDRLPVNHEALDRLMSAMTYHINNLRLKHKSCGHIFLNYHIKQTGDIELMLFIDGSLSTLLGTFLKVADV